MIARPGIVARGVTPAGLEVPDRVEILAQIRRAREHEYWKRTRHSCLLCADGVPSATYCGRLWCRACGRIWR